MTKEKQTKTQNGMGFLLLLIGITGALIYTFTLVINLDQADSLRTPLIIAHVVIFAILMALYGGFFTIEPNTSAVLLLFGKYIGTERAEGFRWANPFFTKKKVSLRVHNFDSKNLKVNDLKGNPVEISAVVVWKVTDTAMAVFEVEDYKDFISVQTESAVRHLASAYPYDATDDEPISLRSSIDEISHALTKEIQERVQSAGIIITESRINHLAYAQEIAQAMLQRQQAEAIIAARTKIVEGAVSMVEMALKRLSEDKIVDLDDERKAAMVSNLLVVLCSDRAAQPVINSGTLY